MQGVEHLQVAVLAAQLANVGLFLIDDKAQLCSFPAHSCHRFMQFFLCAGKHIEVVRIPGGFLDTTYDLDVVVYGYRQKNPNVL